MTSIDQLIARRKPGYSLEQPFYTDPRILELEFDRIFSRRWLFACPAALIPGMGDYALVQVLRESIIIVRGDDGVVRGFFNVCRHRGSHICLEPRGSVKQLVCPYHAWVYDLHGRLKSARMTAEDFDLEANGLHPVHVREEQGLIFMCLADEPRDDFAPAAAGMADAFARHEIHRTKVASHERYDVKANWKLLRENFWECYHCVPNHPEYCSKVPSAAAYGIPHRQEELAAKGERQREQWDALGISSEAYYSGDLDPWFRCGGGGQLADGAVSNSIDGQAVAPLLGTLPEAYTGYIGMAMPQNFTLEGSRDHIVTLRLLPLDPLTTAVDIWWLVRDDAQQGRDYDPDQVAQMWKRTAEQDWTICEANQAGVLSSRYAPGQYTPVEEHTDRFVTWVLAQLA